MKTITCAPADIEAQIAANAPKIENPVNKYTLDESSIKAGENNTYTADLKATAKKYTVTLDGNEAGKYSYEELATVTSDTDVTFIVNGKGVTNGKSYTFYVTGDIDVTTSATAPVDSFASIDWTATISSGGRITVELLSTGNSDKFARMGVVICTSADTQTSDLEAAVLNDTNELGKTKVFGNIAVHTSNVQAANESGQYQFIYAPSTKSTTTKTAYYRTFVVQNDGTVLLSEAQAVNYANITA